MSTIPTGLADAVLGALGLGFLGQGCNIDGPAHANDALNAQREAICPADVRMQGTIDILSLVFRRALCGFEIEMAQRRLLTGAVGFCTLA